MQIHHTLLDWENVLRDQVGAGDLLLGQLPLGRTPYDEDDMNALGHLLAARLGGRTFDDALGTVERRYPLSFALYLVLQGIYNYKQGAYWPAVVDQLAVDAGSNTAQMGQAFRRILRRFQLPTFEHIHGFANLVPILAHGGIPNYSLGDFFRLIRNTTSGSLFSMDAETLIDEWERNPDEAFQFIDRPVQRFVLHGGAVAEDFINRCLRLIDSESDDEIAQLALPQRVVDGYRQWQERAREWGFQRQRIRLSRPVLYLDPYGDGVCLELPPQSFPPGISFARLTWLLTASSQHREILCDRDRTADGYIFTVPEVIMAPCAAEYVLSLRQDDETIRTWTLSGLKEPPLLLFDPDTGEILNERLRTQPGERWILYLDTHTLTITDGRKTAELPQQFGEWGRYAIEEWDVAPGSRIRLVAANGDQHTVHISNELALRRPYLEGGHQPLLSHIRSKFPLYSGSPPGLVISFSSTPDDSQFARWRITVRADGPARPAQRQSYLLQELKPWITFKNDRQVLLDLSAPCLLGVTPAGRFEIDAQGPFGRGRHLGLRVVSHLQIEGHHQLYLSESDGPCSLELQCDPADLIQCISDAGVELKVTSVTDKSYLVVADPTIHHVKLAYVDREQIRVPFTVVVRRLRWALWQSSQPETFTWLSSPMRIFPGALEDMHRTELYVDLPTLPEDTMLFGGWRLVDGLNKVLAERPPDLRRSRQQFSIPLAELLPSFRLARENGDTLCLQIWLHRQNGQTLEDFVNAFYLVPNVSLGELQAECQASGEHLHLRLHWQAPHPLQHLHLALWPVDLPWIEEPLILPVADVASGHAEWQIHRTQLPGSSDYRGAFAGRFELLDPWSGNPLERPAPGDPGILILEPSAAIDYYQDLETKVYSGEAAPEEALILLAYRHRNRHINRMHNTNRQLKEYAEKGLLDLGQLVLWADLVRDLGDRNAYKLVQWTLFKDDIIDRLGDIPRESLLARRYLTHIPERSPDALIFLRLLIAGFPQVRRRCIEGLCQQKESIGLDELLEDVQAGKILISEAAEMLEPVYEFAIGYFSPLPSKDAFEIVRELAVRTGSNPNWIEPGFGIETDLGFGLVLAIRNRTEKQVLDRCLVTDERDLDVEMKLPYGQTIALLHLNERKLILPAGGVHQCSVCRKVVGSELRHTEAHFRQIHPYESLKYRRVDPPVFKLTHFVVHFPTQGTENEPAPNPDH